MSDNFNKHFVALDISPGASADEIKAAYHRQAKANHPDLFPESERDDQHLKMMRINEAYLLLMNRKDSPPGTSGEPGKRPVPPPVARRKRSRRDKPDPAYEYYRQGFDYFSRGRALMSRRFSPRESRPQLDDQEWERIKLVDALAALKDLEEAYKYFLVLLRLYPKSPWVADARERMLEIQKTGELYTKICEEVS